MEEIIQLIIKTYGILGLLILSPCVACWLIGKEYVKVTIARAVDAENFRKELTAVSEKANERVIKAQEQRVDDAIKVRDKLVDIVSEQAAMNRETNLALDRVGDFLSNHHARLSG